MTGLVHTTAEVSLTGSFFILRLSLCSESQRRTGSTDTIRLLKNGPICGIQSCNTILYAISLTLLNGDYQLIALVFGLHHFTGEISLEYFVNHQWIFSSWINRGVDRSLASKTTLLPLSRVDIADISLSVSVKSKMSRFSVIRSLRTVLGMTTILR